MKRRYLLSICTPLLIILAGCSEQPKTEQKKEAEKPAEPVSAQYAFHQMFLYARGNFAQDAQPLRLQNVNIPEVKSAGGKAGAWQATFVSPKLNRSRSMTYSVVESGGNLHKGVFAGPEQSWSPSGQAKPFLVQAFKTDATTAYETAMKQKNAQEYAKKHPDMPVNFLLEYTSRFPNPAWRVIWGDSPATSNFSIFVDAATGQYLETMR